MVAVDKAALALETLRRVADGLDDRLEYNAQDLSISAAVDGGQDVGAGLCSGLIRRLAGQPARERVAMTGAELKSILKSPAADEVMGRLQGAGERRGRRGG